MFRSPFLRHCQTLQQIDESHRRGEGKKMTTVEVQHRQLCLWRFGSVSPSPLGFPAIASCQAFCHGGAAAWLGAEVARLSREVRSKAYSQQATFTGWAGSSSGASVLPGWGSQAVCSGVVHMLRFFIYCLFRCNCYLTGGPVTFSSCESGIIWKFTTKYLDNRRNMITSNIVSD